MSGEWSGVEFVTIHELARLSGISTATIRLDIKTGKIPIAAPGKRGRGNPTRIRILDLEGTDRVQYQQLARRIAQGSPLDDKDSDSGKFTVNELALRTGLSPQVVRKDIIDGKLRAQGGGRRGSPYFIFLEDLSDAARMEYRRLTETQRAATDQMLETIQNELSLLKKEIMWLREKLSSFENRSHPGNSGQAGGETATAAQPSQELPDIIRVPVASISLPNAFERYYVNEEKLKHLTNRVHSGEDLEPVQVRKLDNGSYLLRRGIAQYHVAQELGVAAIPAYLENSEE